MGGKLESTRRRYQNPTYCSSDWDSAWRDCMCSLHPNITSDISQKLTWVKVLKKKKRSEQKSTNISDAFCQNINQVNSSSCESKHPPTPPVHPCLPYMEPQITCSWPIQSQWDTSLLPLQLMALPWVTQGGGRLRLHPCGEEAFLLVSSVIQQRIVIEWEWGFSLDGVN